MTHPLKTVWILIFSIFAMLMSSYAASSPSMVSMMMSMDSAAEMSHQRMESVPPSSQVRQVDCHSMSEESRSSHSMVKQSTGSASSCSNPDDGPHNCCISACSTTFYPLQNTQPLSDIRYSLALHHPLTIGDKILRPQSLLRPPSA